MSHRIFLLSFAAFCALAAAGCRSEKTLPHAASPRVVTYSPALTSMVFAMGLGDHVVGVGNFCRLPAGQDRPRVGDLNVRAEAILAVEPDLILCQQKVEDFAAVRAADDDLRVELIPIETLADIAAAARRIGQLLGEPQTGERAAAAFEARLRQVAEAAPEGKPVRALFVMGTESPSVAGPGTFLAEMIELAGGVNAGADVPGMQAWRGARLELIARANPQVLIVLADPGKADAARAYWQDKLPARVVVVTDDNWIRPGTHIADMAEEMLTILHAGGLRS